MQAFEILPISFTPVYKVRIWGGRSLEQTLKRTLPQDSQLYGEAWELVDREGDQSVVSYGKFKGVTLNNLWTNHREEIFGENLPESERFPMLFKILDCQQDLSIQVHPTPQTAKKFGGEPKSEMWYIADCKPKAKLYVGLKKGRSEKTLRAAIESGSVEDEVNAIEPVKGQSIYLKSGRVHAIGAGFLIFEIQQNSDTTYRVFDWNRKGQDGKPRTLHIEESLASIDYDDEEPSMDNPADSCLVEQELFTVRLHEIDKGGVMKRSNLQCFSIITIISGVVIDNDGNLYKDGDTFILPKGGSDLEVEEGVLYLESNFT